jgi:hypothetical protein
VYFCTYREIKCSRMVIATVTVISRIGGVLGISTDREDQDPVLEFAQRKIEEQQRGLARRGRGVASAIIDVSGRGAGTLKFKISAAILILTGRGAGTLKFKISAAIADSDSDSKL